MLWIPTTLTIKKYVLAEIDQKKTNAFTLKSAAFAIIGFALDGASVKKRFG